MTNKLTDVSELKDEAVYYLADIQELFAAYNLPDNKTTIYQMMKDGRINNVSRGGLTNGRRRVQGKYLKQAIKTLTT